MHIYTFILIILNLLGANPPGFLCELRTRTRYKFNYFLLSDYFLLYISSIFKDTILLNSPIFAQYLL